MVSFFITKDVFETRKCTKKESKEALEKIADLYEDINLNLSNRALSMARMKECISLQKKEKLIEDINAINKVLTDEEKVVTYFYLLDPKEKIQILRQIKDKVVDKNNVVQLLEEEDKKRENIDIPVEKTLRLKK